MRRKTDPTRDDHRAPGHEDKTRKTPAAAGMDAAVIGLTLGTRSAPEQTEDREKDIPETKDEDKAKDD